MKNSLTEAFLSFRSSQVFKDDDSSLPNKKA